MKTKQNFNALVILFLSFYCCLLILLYGCQKMGIENTAFKLTPELSTNEVYTLFSGYEIVSIRTGDVAIVGHNATIFQNDQPIALRITFSTPISFFHLWESCDIYFGQNGKVLGYQCERPH